MLAAHCEVPSGNEGRCVQSASGRRGGGAAGTAGRREAPLALRSGVNGATRRRSRSPVSPSRFSRTSASSPYEGRPQKQTQRCPPPACSPPRAPGPRRHAGPSRGPSAQACSERASGAVPSPRPPRPASKAPVTEDSDLQKAVTITTERTDNGHTRQRIEKNDRVRTPSGLHGSRRASALCRRLDRRSAAPSNQSARRGAGPLGGKEAPPTPLASESLHPLSLGADWLEATKALLPLAVSPRLAEVERVRRERFLGSSLLEASRRKEAGPSLHAPEWSGCRWEPSITPLETRPTRAFPSPLVQEALRSRGGRSPSPQAVALPACSPLPPALAWAGE